MTSAKQTSSADGLARSLPLKRWVSFSVSAASVAQVVGETTQHCTPCHRPSNENTLNSMSPFDEAADFCFSPPANTINGSPRSPFDESAYEYFDQSVDDDLLLMPVATSLATPMKTTLFPRVSVPLLPPRQLYSCSPCIPEGSALKVITEISEEVNEEPRTPRVSVPL